MRHVPSETDGRQALRDHLVEKASQARACYGPMIDATAMARMLGDPQVVRYPVELVFRTDGLVEGEFAHAEPVGDHPSSGFRLVIHPCFEDRPDVWPALMAYHLPPINYGDIVTDEDCETFGATLLGLDPEEYYSLLCKLADGIPSPAQPG